MPEKSPITLPPPAKEEKKLVEKEVLREDEEAKHRVRLELEIEGLLFSLVINLYIYRGLVNDIVLLRVMDQDQQLINASQMGDVDTLYALIQKDSYVLEHIDKLPFANSPLHFAASAGCTEFAMEIMKLMPSFAWKLNQDGFSPIHLALQNEPKQWCLGCYNLMASLSG
ncbi:hypothetical protein GH714_038198 [Hevea brasiliensis]|uniref:Uncharacterized protein n=1 Tax=Hevea brasiliensis TaxID=3981 RepID=A0A6A6MSG2_HEVBR|nr:hypothetical protein GH714_038198 [Hevea brasiliensis]